MKDPNNTESRMIFILIFTDIGTVKAVDGVSFNIPTGKLLEL